MVEAPDQIMKQQMVLDCLACRRCSDSSREPEVVQGIEQFDCARLEGEGLWGQGRPMVWLKTPNDTSWPPSAAAKIAASW